jgi:DNA-binding GntR family transcriptional regulator
MREKFMRGWPAHDAHAHPELYRAILERILNGELAPGQRLVEEELARTHAVSRTPVREILFALEKDGLVERVKNKGARVAAFTADDVEELFDIRKALEVSCVPHALTNLRMNDMLELDCRFRGLASMTGAQLRAEQSELDLLLHYLIVNNSGNRRLVQLMGALSTIVNALQLASYRLGERADEAAAEHHAILRAMLKRDVELTQKLLTVHIDHGKRNALELLLGFDRGARPKPSEGQPAMPVSRN